MVGKLVAGRIDPSSTRAADWQRIFQSDLVPLLSEAQVMLPLPELGMRGCYLLDLRRLDEGARNRLVAHLAARFTMPAGDVVGALDQFGVPILAADVALVRELPTYWL